MAAIEPEKLNSLCNSINDIAQKYVSDINAETNKMKEAFNEAWVSPSAEMLATEISNCLRELATKIQEKFQEKDETLRISVDNFNNIEGTRFGYPGFSFGMPNTDVIINKTLPNGKTGVADGADLTSIEVPMNNLTSAVEADLDSIVNTVRGADAFDNNEQDALTSSVTNIKNKFSQVMQELKSSLSTRMSGEISQRDALNQANISNLGA